MTVDATATFPLNAAAAFDRSEALNLAAEKKVLSEPTNFARQSTLRVAAAETLP
jgi:hypothetical protein